MKNYEELFQEFDLPNISSREYKNAEHYARDFQRCSVLIDIPITYSINTKIQNDFNQSHCDNSRPA